MIYKVTYPNAKTVRMHNANTRKFESILKQAVKDGFIAKWERDPHGEQWAHLPIVQPHPFAVENL